jgi:hypothetical protein
MPQRSRRLRLRSGGPPGSYISVNRAATSGLRPAAPLSSRVADRHIPALPGGSITLYWVAAYHCIQHLFPCLGYFSSHCPRSVYGGVFSGQVRIRVNSSWALPISCPGISESLGSPSSRSHNANELMAKRHFPMPVIQQDWNSSRFDGDLPPSDYRQAPRGFSEVERTHPKSKPKGHAHEIG